MSAPTEFIPVMAALLELVASDADLIELTGAGADGKAKVFQRYTVERIEEIPGVYWYDVSAGLTENYEEHSLRWDIWATSDVEATRIENRIRRVVHNELPVTLGGNVCWSQVRGTQDFGGGKRGNVWRRVLETRLDIFRHRPTEEIEP